MEAHMDGLAHGAQRDADGRFVVGHSGNPSGKKPGIRNRATLLREALGDGEDIAAARVVIDKALSGDMVAARFVVGRLEPRPRGRAIALDLPEGAGARDIVAAYDATVRAMATGEITPDEALQVSRVLDGRLRALKMAREEKRNERATPKTEPSPACGRGQGEGLGAPAEQDWRGPSTQPSPRPSPVNGRGSLSRKEGECLSPESPAFHLHFAGDGGGAIGGGSGNAPYWAQPYPGGSP
jgi:hypothetical protein